jgi:cytochrome c oxidase subunit 2
MSRAAALAVLGVLSIALAGAAFATEPHPWQLGMQEPGSVVKDYLHSFHNMLLWIISLITVFVLGLMAS